MNKKQLFYARLFIVVLMTVMAITICISPFWRIFLEAR